LFLAGDEGDGCYRVEEGLLKASVGAPNGGERILGILGPGSVVGELSMIDGAPRSASVTALRNSKLCFVSQTDFDAIGKSSPDIYRDVMKMLALRLRDTNNALAASSFLSVKGRVARALLNLAEAFGKDVGNGRILIRRKVNQSDLAAMQELSRLIELRDALLRRFAGRRPEHEGGEKHPINLARAVSIPHQHGHANGIADPVGCRCCTLQSAYLAGRNGVFIGELS
jgi:CRP-like cAMP-binding protein